MDFNKKAKEIFEQNKAVGWWDDPDRCIWSTLQLVITEVAEATEGYRKDLMDDHLPHRKMEEVELADTLIRLLDLGGRCQWEYNETERYEAITFKTLVETNAAHHYSIVYLVLKLGDAIGDQRGNYKLSDPLTSIHYSRVIDYILAYSESRDFDIVAAMEEKLKYNTTRKDHKRENRAKEGGKKI